MYHVLNILRKLIYKEILDKREYLLSFHLDAKVEIEIMTDIQKRGII